MLMLCLLDVALKSWDSTSPDFVFVSRRSFGREKSGYEIRDLA